MSRSRLFFAFAAFLLFVSGFTLVSPSLMLVDMIYPTRVDSLYLTYSKLEEQSAPLSDSLEFSPADMDIDFSEFNIHTSDSLLLEGWYIPATDTPAHTLLILHELNQSKLLYLDQIKQFHDRGLNVCIFDLRAHGSSDGTEFSVGNASISDVKHALHQLSSMEGTNKLILHGIGLGADIALQTALEDTFCSGLILENPIISMNTFLSRYSFIKWGVMRSIWSPVLERRVEELAGFPLDHINMVQLIKETTVPMLFLSGSEDSVSYISETLEIYQQSNSPKKDLLLIEGAGHLNIAQIGGEKYYNKIASFVNVSFPKKKKSRYKKLAEVMEKG